MDVGTILLGTIDHWDCVLASYGDAVVPEEIRRGIFGLFQQAHPNHREHIRMLATRFTHVRSLIHGLLFLKKPRGSDMLAFELEHYFVQNNNLLADVDFVFLGRELNKILHIWED